MNFVEEAEALREDLIGLRRRLHSHPECGLHLPMTQAEILNALEGLPLEITKGSQTTSVTAVLRGSEDGPVVLLRGDMDALPLREDTSLPFASEIDDVMHACGHDLHVAILVGAARLLSAYRERLLGDVIFMFQPGEEGYDGAGVMIEEGVLSAAGRPIDAAYALHVFSDQITPRGFATRVGTLMAGCDELHVTVRGKGGHGASPHLARDPVQAIAQMVSGLQVTLSRRISPVDPAVISVGMLHAGTGPTIIPDIARFEATVRTFSEATRAEVIRSVANMLEGIATAHGVDVDIDFIELYPVTVNDQTETLAAAEAISEIFGPDRFEWLPHPFMGSEDFSRVLALVPGAYIALGARRLDLPDESVHFNHSPRADFDESVITDGAVLLAELAVRRMNRDCTPPKGALP